MRFGIFRCLLLVLVLVAVSVHNADANRVFERRVAAVVRKLGLNRNNSVSRLAQILSRNARTMERLLFRAGDRYQVRNLTRRVGAVENQIKGCPKRMKAWGMKITKVYVTRIKRLESRVWRLEKVVNSLLALRNMSRIPMPARIIRKKPTKLQKVPKICLQLNKWKTQRLNKTSCVYLSTRPASWVTARRWCRLKGGDLLTIRSSIELQNITRWTRKKMRSDDFLWIGLHDRIREGRFDWVDRSPRVVSNWKKGQPNGGRGMDQDCVAMKSRGGQWFDLGCRNKKPYICRFNAKSFRQ